MQIQSSEKKPTGSNFRSVLQEELVSRCRSNPNYSLRAFARNLKVEPSALSQILNGKRPLTEKMKLRLGSAMGLSLKFLEKLPVDEKQQKFNGTPRAYQQMTHDTFAAISDWYHFAILELTYVTGFQADAVWISRKLGITKSEANIAVERLFRLGLLQKKASGEWIDASESGELTHLTPEVSSSAARRYQIQLLELSQKAVQEVDLSLRNHTSATLCFEPKEIKAASAAITAFRRKFAQEFQPSKKATAVYQLQISFFPLTKELKKESL